MSQAAAAESARARAAMGRQVVRGMGWSAGGQVVAQGIRFVQTLVLARLLLPEEFGLAGMVGVAFGLISIFCEFGIPTAVIQQPDLDHETLTALFWAGTGITLVGTLVAAASAPLLAWLYGEPQVASLGAVAALGFLIGGPAMVPNGLLNRDMRYRAMVTCDLVYAVWMLTSAAALARAGWGPWSLVLSGLSGGLLRSLLLTAASGFRPGWPRGFARLAGLLRFGRALTVTSVLEAVVRSLDTLIVGAMLGSHAVGVYMVGYNLVAYPETKLAGLLNRVMLPAYSRLQANAALLSETAAFAFETVLLLTTPMVAGLAVVAPLFVPVVLEPRWSDMVRPLQVLALAGPALAGLAALHTPLVARGRADLTAQLAFLKLVLAGLSMPVGAALGGVQGVAWAVVGTTWVSLAASARAAREAFGLPLGETARATATSLLLAGAMAWAVARVAGRVPAAWPPAGRLAAEVAVGVGAYALLVAVARRAWVGRLWGLLRRGMAPEVAAAAPEEAAP